MERASRGAGGLADMFAHHVRTHLAVMFGHGPTPRRGGRHAARRVESSTTAMGFASGAHEKWPSTRVPAWRLGGDDHSKSARRRRGGQETLIQGPRWRGRNHDFWFGGGLGKGGCQQ